jgi:hypothetical protein
MYLGMVARGEDEGVSLGEGLGGRGFPVGRVCGGIDAGQTGKDLVGCFEGVVKGRPPFVLMFRKNLSCSVDI